MALYEATFNTYFRRCVTGCSTETPACPECADGQVCQLSPLSCDACQSTTCVASATATTSSAAAVSSSKSKSGNGPSTGAIAGGVIAGVVAIAIVTYLVWRFCIKPKRQQYEQDDWIDEQEDDMDGMPAEKAFTMRRDARASTHTVASVASTVLTRASNIIQIAYIPGVTNRSAPSTPGLLVPPVPPIPIALSSAASSPRYEDEHFFMPGDLRDSTYSGVSDRTSYARNSVASTIYGKNAVVSPIPAQTVIRGKAAVVSVKSSAQTGELTPPVPNIDYNKFGPPSPAFSVGSTFLNNATVNSASSAMPLRPQMISVSSAASKKSSSSKDSINGSVSDTRESLAITLINDASPTADQDPFSNPQTSHQSMNTLSAVIPEVTLEANGDMTDASRKRVSTPFGDEHEVRDS